MLSNTLLSFFGGMILFTAGVGGTWVLHQATVQTQLAQAASSAQASIAAAGCFNQQAGQIIQSAVQGAGINTGGTVTVSATTNRAGYAQNADLTMTYQKPGSRFWMVQLPGVSATTSFTVFSTAAPGTPGAGEACVQPQGAYTFSATMPNQQQDNSPQESNSGGGNGSQEQQPDPSHTCLAASWGGQCTTSVTCVMPCGGEVAIPAPTSVTVSLNTGGVADHIGIMGIVVGADNNGGGMANVPLTVQLSHPGGQTTNFQVTTGTDGTASVSQSQLGDVSAPGTYTVQAWWQGSYAKKTSPVATYVVQAPTMTCRFCAQAF